MTKIKVRTPEPPPTETRIEGVDQDIKKILDDRSRIEVSREDAKKMIDTLLDERLELMKQENHG